MIYSNGMVDVVEEKYARYASSLPHRRTGQYLPH